MNEFGLRVTSRKTGGVGPLAEKRDGRVPGNCDSLGRCEVKQSQDVQTMTTEIEWRRVRSEMSDEFSYEALMWCTCTYIFW